MAVCSHCVIGGGHLDGQSLRLSYGASEYQNAVLINPPARVRRVKRHFLEGKVEQERRGGGLYHEGRLVDGCGCIIGLRVLQCGVV